MLIHIIILLGVVLLAVSIANSLIEISIENKFGKDCSNSFTIGVMSGLLSAIIIAIPIVIIVDKKTPDAIDVYRNNVPVQRNLISLATYVTLFPQLVAGPIVRYADVEAELIKRDVSYSKFARGVRRFIIGLSKPNPFFRINTKIFNKIN